MQIEIVSISKQGGRLYNEDVHGQWNDERYLACLVADGAGGHGGGDVAAATVCSSVLKGFEAAPTLDADVLRALLEHANLDIVARQTEGGALSAMRSTVVLAVVDMQENQLVWAHSGDSRAYLFRGGAIVARTTDHSVVQQLVTSGMLDEEGARLHPHRNMLLSALGSIEEPPDISISERMRVLPADVLMLCSDGVWEPLGDACLVNMLQASRTATQWTEMLHAKINEIAKPGHDNFTAMTLWFTGEHEQSTRLMSPVAEHHTAS